MAEATTIANFHHARQGVSYVVATFGLDAGDLAITRHFRPYIGACIRH